MEKRFLCLDVGGTEIKAAAVDGSGGLLRPIRHFPANAKEPAGALLEHFASVIRQLSAAPECSQGIRLAFPGPFDYPNGICLMQGLDKFDALYGMDLRRELAVRLAVPPEDIQFANDANAFALGEMAFGGAKDARRALFICIGTGCGSAFGIDGKLVSSGVPGVPEGGCVYHVPFLDGRIDDYLSRRGLMALTRQQLGAALDGKALAQRATEADAAAQRCFLLFGERVRDALLPFLTGFRPEVLCLGGQIMQSAALFLDPLETVCRALAIKTCITTDTSLRTLQGLTRI